MKSDYRYEIKFVLDDSRLTGVMSWLYKNTSANKSYDNRIVNSIYFDDINPSSVRDNLSGISKRHKSRLRWYGKEINSSAIFEVKTKTGRLGSKLAYPIKSISGKIMELNLDKITSACIKDLAMQDIVFDHHLMPTLLVNYEREYYETHEGIRITIDHDIKFSDTQLYTKLDENNYFLYPIKVMEIKFTPDMKEAVSKLVKPLNISPTRHSKYLIGLATLGYAVYI